MTRKRGAMEEDLARSALQQISDLGMTEKVTFHVMGEPRLHPRFFGILDFAGELRLPVGLTTNGALLTLDTIRALAQKDIHQIDVSLQTPDEESFLATRGTRIDFETYRGRLLDLLAACAERPSPPIFKIRIMTTRFASGMKAKLGIPDFVGTSEVLRQTLRVWTGLMLQRLGRDQREQISILKRIDKISIYGWNVIEISPKIFIETYVLTDWGNAFTGEKIIEANYGCCFGMRDHFAILYNGDVTLCCVDYDGRTVVGNLGDASLTDILNSPEVEKIVRGFRRGRLEHPYCRRCLGSSSRLGAWIKPAASILGLKVLKPLFYRKYRLFD